MRTDRSKAQWIDLGIHTEACMTEPGTCDTSGGAISVWQRVTSCSGSAGSIVTTMDIHTGESTGCAIYCTSQQITLVALKIART